MKKNMFLLSMLLTASLYAVGQSYSIENCVNQFVKEKSLPTSAGYQYWFADKTFLEDGRTLKLSVVDVGKATHAPHTHPEDEFFFILEGKAEFYLAGETQVVGPYTSLYCPSNVEHGIRNAGETQLKYLVIKKYEIAEKK
jgi:mannose-6-phosphate isomerase-like protein (cupin superfamily)